jgi:hypothetical protein
MHSAQGLLAGIDTMRELEIKIQTYQKKDTQLVTLENADKIMSVPF